jgi:hypothetical protein
LATGVQAFGPEPAVEAFDERVVCRLSRAGEVQGHTLGVGPQVQIAGHELRTLIHADRFGRTDFGAGAVQSFNDVFGLVAEPRIGTSGQSQQVAVSSRHEAMRIALRWLTDRAGAERRIGVAYGRM